MVGCSYGVGESKEVGDQGGLDRAVRSGGIGSQG